MATDSPAIPANLGALVAKTYAAALAAGNLTFTASAATTEIRLHAVTVYIPTAGLQRCSANADLQYHIRFCPSLLRKPGPAHSAGKPNPFLPPQKGLLVASAPGYNLVLNRFPVIGQHFLLCTADFQPQAQPLRACDLAAVHAVLNAWPGPEGGEHERGRLYGFFNSGEHSGASQPHRHIQFLPLPPLAQRELPFDAAPAPTPTRTPTPAPATLWTHPGMPFVSFCIRFSTSTAEEFVSAYQTLLARVEEAAGGGGGGEGGGREGRGVGVSYNMGVTREWMVLAPRTSEDGGREGVGVNGTVLAGELLAKRQEDWDFFGSGGLEEVLRGIGIPAQL